MSDEEQELLSIETYSGNIIGKIHSKSTEEEIQWLIQSETGNKSHVKINRVEKDKILFGFIDNRHALLEWKYAYKSNWSLELDTSKWGGCNIMGTTLITFYCSRTPVGTCFTELPDLSQCVSLKVLHCDYNDITKLPDLSKCVLLQELHCEGNLLTELPDLSKCVSLTQLYCRDNQLTELPDLSKCVSLTTLYCSPNLLAKGNGLKWYTTYYYQGEGRKERK